MLIETKFNYDDLVFPIWYRAERIVIPNNCSVCNDTGKVTLSNRVFTCPSCRGYIKSEEGGIKWYVTTNQGRIGKIEVNYYSNEYKNKDGREDRITYMISTTGVGSGTVHNEINLFLSEEEAQKECDKRNKDDTQ